MGLRHPQKPYHTNQRMVCSRRYHVLFCPKSRRKVLVEAVAARCRDLVLAKQRDYRYTVMHIEIMPDPVHFLLEVDPGTGIDSVVGKIEGNTSHELGEEFPWLKKRLSMLWTRCKFIATVGAATLEVVQSYDEN